MCLNVTMPLEKPIVVESSRLIVRPVAEADLPALLAVNGDDAVTRFLPYASWQSLADGRAWYERMSILGARGESVQYVIIERASALAIGTCLLFRYEATSARAELGYVLGRKYWGQGIMREALTALIGCAFGGYALRRLEAEVDPLNSASTRLIEKLGFTREGLLRQRWVDKGAAHDTILYGLLKDEWQPASGVASTGSNGNTSRRAGQP
jgi:[ribosomal protein S5]-alanine N-acetyltransferase